LHNNCSGKHTFMLAACAAQHWARDYRPLEHPLQQKNRALLESLGGAKLGVGVDGCSVPTFFAPLSAMARTWAALASAVKRDDGVLGRIGHAMHAQPFFVSGSERLDLLVTQRASEPLTVKVGAEGLFCVARLTRGQGLAVKVHSGNADALAVAVKHVLDAVGVRLSGDWPWTQVRNVRDVVVGERRVTGLAPSESNA
jgi:L-asparaginase II